MRVQKVNPNAPSRMVVKKEERFQTAMLNRRLARSLFRRLTSARAWSTWTQARLAELPAITEAKRTVATANGAVRCDRLSENGNRVLHLMCERVAVDTVPVFEAINTSLGWNDEERSASLQRLLDRG